MATTTKPFSNWDEVMAFALGLPGAEASTSYGAPTVRIRGKPIVYPGRERGSFAIASPRVEKELLIETDPDTFWEATITAAGRPCWFAMAAQTANESKRRSCAPGGIAHPKPSEATMARVPEVHVSQIGR